jgi:phosphomannomutase/phosphoglucomutase
LYFAAKNLGTGSGVMVTASHNPAPDNGFKVMLANHTLVDTEIYALRQRILDKDFKRVRVPILNVRLVKTTYNS